MPEHDLAEVECDYFSEATSRAIQSLLLTVLGKTWDTRLDKLDFVLKSLPQCVKHGNVIVMTNNTYTFEISHQNGITILTPVADTLSYRDIDVQREGQEIINHLKSNDVQVLIVDMSRANYFGSLMIGIINSYGQTVKQRNGQMFLCGASDEMLAVLKIMKLDSLWPHFPKRADALKVAKAWKASP